MTDWNLSDKITNVKVRDEKRFITKPEKIKQTAIWHSYILTEDVKEFIRQEYDLLILYRQGKITFPEMLKRRDKLAGDDLQ